MSSIVRTPPRPTTFEGYRGNQLIKQVVLAALAEGNLGHITIEGPSGSGKTLLAELIARALLCLSPRSDGTACGICQNCQVPLQYLIDFKLVRCPTQGTAANMTEIVEYVDMRPFIAPYRVLIFDEAQGLTVVAQDMLLGPLGAEGRRTLMMFTTISADVLNFPLLSRSRRFTVELPDFGQSMSYLADMARTEGITIEADAMKLIAAYSKGYRILAENLAAAADAAAGGAVTTAIVRSALLRDKSQGILVYLAAAAQGQYEAQVSTLDEMSLSANEKVEWLLAVLTHLSTRNVGPTLSTRERDNLNLLLADEDCQEVVGHFADLARKRGQTLQGLFDEVLEFWLAVPASLGDHQLAGHVLRFQNLLFVSAAPRAIGPIGADRSEQARSKLQPRKAAPWRERSGPGLIDPQGPHLTLRQAFELYEPATFLSQAFGKGFNVWTTIDYAGSDRTDKENVEIVSQMLKQLRARFFDRPAQEHGPAADLHRITFNERIAAGGLRSTVLLHVPASIKSGLDDFFARWLKRCPEILRFDCDVQFHDHMPAVLSHQWTLMRKLWAGLSPDEQLDGVPALQRLRIKPADARVIGPIECRRYSISGSIGDGARRQATIEQMGHLSAWSDGAWDHLFRGWEGPEHTVRSGEAQSRERRVAEINRSYTVNNALEQSSLKAALAIERATWPVHPHHRDRGWKGRWWLDGPLC